MSLIDIMEKINMPDSFIANTLDDELLDDSYIFIQNIFKLAKKEDPDFTPFRAQGVTQCCIGDLHNQDYVIKIPFTHWVEYDDDEPEEMNYNYSQMACDMAVEIAENDISEFFALVHVKGTTLNGYPIYIQSWVKASCQGGKELRKTPISNTTPAIAAETFKEYTNPFNEEWTEDCIELYGKEKFISLLNFLSTYHSDMHSGNYGWDKNGKPKILDYSGYYEEDF